ncbi:hypothetical protein ACHAQJ_004305 [Trichoderma viride]
MSDDADYRQISYDLTMQIRSLLEIICWFLDILRWLFQNLRQKNARYIQRMNAERERRDRETPNTEDGVEGVVEDVVMGGTLPH